MRQFFWTWIISGATVLCAGTYMVTTYIIHPTATRTLPETVIDQSKSTDNPLLTAEMLDVAQWFPGGCFAEIYGKEPSFRGVLVKGCIRKVISYIKSYTGITLTEADIRSPEVIDHFKQLYGWE